MIQTLSRWIEPYLPVDHLIRLLDVACGQGYALATLQDIGFIYGYGIDSSHKITPTLLPVVEMAGQLADINP